MDRGAWQATAHGVAQSQIQRGRTESDTTERFHFLSGSILGQEVQVHMPQLKIPYAAMNIEDPPSSN